MNIKEFTALQDFIFGWGHGKARIVPATGSEFECEFELMSGTTEPHQVRRIQVWTDKTILPSMIVIPATADARKPQQFAISSIMQMTAIDGGEPLEWKTGQSVPKCHK